MTTLFNETIGGFRLLTEYRSFLLDNDDEYNSAKTKEFPSPYGVSFILIILLSSDVFSSSVKFPSPYGVSFILI